MTTASPSSASSSPVKKGLEGVVVSDTALGEVDGTACQLIYRGYEIGELAGRASYEEVCFLLHQGRLPSKTELAAWTGDLAQRRALDPELLRLMPSLPLGDSMAYLRTVVSLIGLADREAETTTPGAMRRQALDLMAATTTIVAMFDRFRSKQPMLGPKPALGHAANFLYMLHGETPSPAHAEAMDTYFVLLAEHGFNASTFAARTTVATQSDLYSGVVAAIGTLKGPLHGAANTKAMQMLEEIGSVDNVAPYVRKTLQDHKRFMGFGHRVYKGEDPRAQHLRRLAETLAATSREPHWFAISERLKEEVWKAKQLAINVDFYSASLLHYLGIPTDLFTPMFACARMAGWTAHILEQAADNRLIRPLSAYVGPRNLKFTPLDQRSDK